MQQTGSSLKGSKRQVAIGIPKAESCKQQGIKWRGVCGKKSSSKWQSEKQQVASGMVAYSKRPSARRQCGKRQPQVSLCHATKGKEASDKAAVSKATILEKYDVVDQFLVMDGMVESGVDVGAGRG